VDILITGGAGFIGSSLVERLSREKNNITVVDNFHTGSEDNLRKFKNSIKIIKCSSGDCEKFEKSYDILFHQGIYSSSPMYKENPLLTARCIEDFLKLLEFARRYDIKIVWASTSSLYNGHDPPHKESMQVKVTDHYTEARYAMERMAELYNKLYGLSIIALRYFSVYGPNELSKKQYANLVTQFLLAMKNNEQPVIYGDGKQTRDFTYVTDVVEANILAARANIKFGIYNVGNGKETSINDMIGIINKKLAKAIKPKYIENKVTNYVARTMADTKKAEKELGFRSKISLEEGIQNLIDFYGN